MALIERTTRHAQQTWWLAPTYAMAEQVWRDLKTNLMSVSGIRISESSHRLELPNGGAISIRSTHYPDTLRGVGLDYVVLDEAAFMEPRVWPEIVRPMLLERRGGALFLSTPFGRNWFWDLFRIGLDPEEPDWQSFHFRSQDNPLIDPAELAAIERVTPARIWREEYLAHFIDDAGQVFRKVQPSAPAAPPYEAGHHYVAGIDWGRDEDYTVMIVIDADTRQMVAMDRFRRVSWAMQRQRIAVLAQRWHIGLILAEANSIGGVNIEALQHSDLPVRPFTMTARSKGPLIEGLALALEQDELALQDEPVLLHELAAYGLTRLPGGGYRYSAPSGQHDDSVIALALAWQAVQQGGPRIDFA